MKNETFCAAFLAVYAAATLATVFGTSSIFFLILHGHAVIGITPALAYFLVGGGILHSIQCWLRS